MAGNKATYSDNVEYVGIETVATPLILPNSGSYPGAVEVTISCTTEGATIRYTTDGIEPTSSSAAYANLLTLTASATVKAKGFKNGFNDSQTSTAVYSIGPVTGLNWQSATSLPVAGSQFDAVEYDGNIYIVDGWNGAVLSPGYRTKINQNGTLTPWEPIPALPTPDQGSGVTAYNGWLYAANLNGNLYRARIADDGNLQEWITETPAALWHGGRLSLEGYGGYLYVLGGWNPPSSFLAEAYFAKINDDGSIGSWSSTTSMPEGRQHQSVHFFNHRAYIVGGYSASGILATCYSAPVNADGTLGEWRQEASLPHSLWYHSSALIYGKIILFGGSSDLGLVRTIYQGEIGSTDGNIANWETAGIMPSDYDQAVGAVYSSTSRQLYFIGGVWLQGSQYTSNVWHSSVAATVPMPQLEIEPISVSTGGSIQFSVKSDPGQRLIIEASGDLENWTRVSTNIAVSGLLRLSESPSVGISGRFYRVLSGQ